MNWLTDWSFDPSILVGLALAIVLYQRGRRSSLRVVGGARPLWPALCFYAGLAFIVLALESPIDALGAQLFAFHMIQHLLLIMVAAPLLILGDPSLTLLRGIPLGIRRATLRTATGPGPRRVLGWLGHRLTPTVIAGIFVLDLYLWHWTPLFDLTLRNDTVHLIEHLCFLGTALAFWAQVIDQRAVHARLSYARRAAYLVLTAAAGNVLAMYLVFTPKPLYAGYAQLTHRPFGMTALADQQIAGALMWVPVLFLFGGAFAVCLYKALDESENEVAPVAAEPYRTVFSTPAAEPGGSAHR